MGRSVASIKHVAEAEVGAHGPYARLCALHQSTQCKRKGELEMARFWACVADQIDKMNIEGKPLH